MSRFCPKRFSCFQNFQERDECLTGRLGRLGPAPPLCCRASRLILRLHQLDMLNSFTEPSDVRHLCRQFLHMPKGTHEVEDQLTHCSRAMLAMSVFSNVALRTGQHGENETCSESSIQARYPAPRFETGFNKALIDDNMFRWQSAYFHRLPAGKAAQYRLMVAQLFQSMRNHTNMCLTLGHMCAVYNHWEPHRCFVHHPLVQAWSPSCMREKPRIPVLARGWRGGVALDWLGLHVNCSSSAQMQPEMTRRLECAGLAWGPVIGEDYFESISLLQAVSAATTSFVVVEAGSHMGYWTLKAAKAFRRRFPEVSSASCHLVLIESTIPTVLAADNLKQNGIYDLCNITFYQSYADSGLLDWLIHAFGRIDLLHVDIQRAELELIAGSHNLPILGQNSSTVFKCVLSF